MSVTTDRIAVQLLGGREKARAVRLASFGPEWIDCRTAAAILCCDAPSIQKARSRYRKGDGDVWRKAIDSRPASDTAETAHAVGLLLLRKDVERVASIRRRCQVSLTIACRVYAAIKSGGPL